TQSLDGANVLVNVLFSVIQIDPTCSPSSSRTRNRVVQADFIGAVLYVEVATAQSSAAPVSSLVLIFISLPPLHLPQPAKNFYRILAAFDNSCQSIVIL